MKIGQISIVLVSLLATAASQAHPPEFESEGTSTILGNMSVNRTVFGDNYGGYGYLATSESEAHQRLQTACDPAANRRYLSAYCHGQSIDPNRPASDLINNTMRSVVIYRLRTHASEYLALNIQAAASDLGEAVELERPECISENSPLWQRAIRRNHNPNTKMSAKLEAIQATLRGANMARALMYGERLEAGSEQNTCESLTGDRAPSCASIQHTSYRLRNSFPALYDYAIQGTQNSPTAIVHKTDHYADFRRSLTFLLGAHNAGNISSDEAKTRGLAYLENGTKVGPYRALEDRFNQALEAASREPSGTLLGQAYREYKKAIRRLKQDHLKRMTQGLANICKNKLVPFHAGNHDRINIYGLALQYPNVIRQTILDMSPSERGLTTAVLCDIGAMSIMQREPQCNGVSGGPLPDNDIDVARWKVNDWPNGSQNYFHLTQPKTPVGAPITVKLNVNFTLGPSLSGLPDTDHNGIPDQLECQLRLWQEDTNTWANCSVGAIPSANLNNLNVSECTALPTSMPVPAIPPTSCPLNSDMAALNPKVNFQINLRPTNENPAPPPSVQLHRCYRLDIPGPLSDRGDCEKVKEVHINKCITEHPSMLTECAAGVDMEPCRTQVTQFCRAEVESRFAANPGAMNRADSSNYTLSESYSVVRHEIFHQMGLADEYYSDERPFSFLGEHNSVMRNSRSLDSRLYPRHLSQILDVLKCPEVSGEIF